MYIKWCFSILFCLSTFDKILSLSYVMLGYRGSTVVKVLCYKSEGRWFDPSWYHWIFH